MVVTRRSTGGSRARPGPGKNQSTISFATRVTKPGSRVDHHGGKPSAAKDKEHRDAVAAAAAVAAPPVVVLTPGPEIEEPVEEKQEEEEHEEEQETVKATEKSEVELEAEEIGMNQIRAYFSKIEKARMAKAMHQEDLSEAERILRYFDVSARFGPCIGISRHRRWQRAYRLGLSPPVEVLAVLLQEESKGTDNVQMAYMDHLMGSTAVGAA